MCHQMFRAFLLTVSNADQTLRSRKTSIFAKTLQGEAQGGEAAGSSMWAASAVVVAGAVEGVNLAAR